MGFYTALTLIGALSAGAGDVTRSRSGLLAIVWGTTLGLALVHWFAISLSARLVDDPGAHHTPGEMLMAQVAMAAIIAIAATIVVLVLAPEHQRLGARLTAALGISVIVWVELRAGGEPRARALTFGALALVGAATVAAAKWLIVR